MTGDVNVTELAGSLELHVATSESESKKPTNVVKKANDVHPRKIRQLCNTNLKWVHKKSEYKRAPGRTETHENNSEAVGEQLEFTTQGEIFEEIFSAKILVLVVRGTVRCATVCKNIPNFTVSTDNVKKLSERHNCSNDADLKTDVVKEAISRKEI